jgi:hypothetical protein
MFVLHLRLCCRDLLRMDRLLYRGFAVSKIITDGVIGHQKIGTRK